ncbi:hypothetical protein V5O48_013815 [Marasmius crinis-equi]|uniref:F-box domain-containing protein n=1 Tax=Marasmius crinis-equi TaxID=585013 RepID=A0ABR3EZ16_9AGAR
MSSVSPPSASLPIELVEQIMSLYWTSPLTSSERIRFVKFSRNVSDLWHAILLRVSATHLYILGPAHASALLDMLGGKVEMPVDFYLHLGGLCRSITIQHANDHLFPAPVGLQRMGAIFRDIIRELSGDHCPLQLPFLRRISLELKNYLMQSVSKDNSFLFARFPKQVTELEINFAYGEDTRLKNIEGIKTHWETFGLKNAESTGLKKLTVLGASSKVTKELLGVFGGSERVQLKQDAWKETEKPVVVDNEEFFDAQESLPAWLEREFLY